MHPQLFLSFKFPGDALFEMQPDFVLEDSMGDLTSLDLEEFPSEDVQASRRNRRLQAKHPVTEGMNLYLGDAKACPKCQAPPEKLSWFYFRSPKETWPMQCGVAGWMAVCDRCLLQVNFFGEMMS